MFRDNTSFENAAELALTHAIQERMGEFAAGMKIEVHARVPFLACAVLLKRPRTASIVHQDIEPAKLADHRSLDALGRAILGDVLQQNQRTLVTAGLDLVGDRCERLLSAGNDCELAAFVREYHGDAATEPHAGAGHERNLAGELQVHRLALDLKGERPAAQAVAVPD